MPPKSTVVLLLVHSPEPWVCLEKGRLFAPEEHGPTVAGGPVEEQVAGGQTVRPQLSNILAEENRF